jgi:hypothetical protein
MKWLLNLFSGNSYTQTASTITRDDGKTYYKSGDLWIDDESNIVQYMGDELYNQNTGVGSSFGDPFGDKQ